MTGVTATKTTIEIACTLTDTRTHCPTCGVECTVVNDRSTRRLRDLNISERAVYLVVSVRQFRCPTCGSCPTERLPFADANKSYTHRQARYVFAWCRKQAYSEVGAIVGMHAKTVERLVLHHCQQAQQLPQRYAGLRRLGIDEQSHRKGKKHFICLLTNLDTGTLVDILPDRKKETLVAYFQALGLAFCQQITAVSCDLWQPYLAVVATCFPQATLVLDRFHVVKLLNQGLDAFRRHLRKEAPDEAGYKQLKWLIFKQYHRLTDAELDTLQAAFAVNAEVKTAYFLREEFHHILDRPQAVDSAIKLLDKWIARIQVQKVTHFDSFIQTLQRHKEPIANYVLDNVSNAVTEVLNNLVRSIRRCAFGMPGFQHLRLRVMAISG
ncbi:ISL3 family transposase [Hymenobacter elongatus]|uniref:ISL3 family transposase n=1 Tax=Hymenobacter elongatus TaxID=877208 RepID=A0A4Z0PDZ4_9BACT|nr:ISL3 family transposase [Hymenobacter elongatus]